MMYLGQMGRITSSSEPSAIALHGNDHQVEEKKEEILPTDNNLVEEVDALVQEMAVRAGQFRSTFQLYEIVLSMDAVDAIVTTRQKEQMAQRKAMFDFEKDSFDKHLRRMYRMIGNSNLGEESRRKLQVSHSTALDLRDWTMRRLREIAHDPMDGAWWCNTCSMANAPGSRCYICRKRVNATPGQGDNAEVKEDDDTPSSSDDQVRHFQNDPN